MRTRFKFVAITLILVAGFVVAVEKSKPVLASTGDSTTESGVSELSEIAVLCATDENEKFEKEWGKYVTQNDLKGTELHETINWVSNEAVIERKKHRRTCGDECNDQAWKAERQKLMNEIARRLERNSMR